MTASLEAMSQAWTAAARNLGGRTHLVSRALEGPAAERADSRQALALERLRC
jgi:hypothetical protein